MFLYFCNRVEYIDDKLSNLKYVLCVFQTQKDQSPYSGKSLVENASMKKRVRARRGLWGADLSPGRGLR